MTIKSKTIDQEEIEHFSKDSHDWWNENGPFAPLHRLNPSRLSYIKKQICEHMHLDFNDAMSLKDISVLDIGCGGGLVSEPLTRLGAHVTGIDADPLAIQIAQDHAQDAGLKISYKNKDISSIKPSFDIVLALEILEHVKDIEEFIKECKRVVKPGGLIIFSTLNRTIKSYALGIIAAEYILRWVPKGTHDWSKFIRPSELVQYSQKNGLKPIDITGLIYQASSQEFLLSDKDIGVNYFLSAKNLNESK